MRNRKAFLPTYGLWFELAARAVEVGVRQRAESTVTGRGLNVRELLAKADAAVTRGHDPDFGRATLGGGYGTPVRIDTPPYYILPCCTALLATYCGLRVDTGMRVLRGDGSPVPGLYAAGETVGGFHGAGYMSGSALGKAAIFGRVAGTGAARDA